MRLHINNFAAISDADIKFDGMTVIAGNNNTGKSTVGKVLYAFFRSLSNLDKRIQTERMESMRDAFSRVPGAEDYGDVIPALMNGVPADKIVADMIDMFWKKGEKIGATSSSEEEKKHILFFFSRSVAESLEQTKKNPDEDYVHSILLRVFDCVFHGQFHPLQSTEGVSRLSLTVKEHENFIQFGHDAWQYSCPTKFIKKARLIATPDILSYVNIANLESEKSAYKFFEKYTFEIIKELRQESSLSVSRQIDSERLLKEIYHKLDEVIGGVFKLDSQNEFALFEGNHSQPTKAANLSMGLKAFVLLRFMLEKGVLSEQDVLILDEPENHLHPEWQVVYAHLLVLLQKTFHLTMMVTTHSNFFVNAMQRFCISEDITKKTHFYLSQPDRERHGFYTFKDMDDSASAIMRSFNSAYDAIDEMSGG